MSPEFSIVTPSLNQRGYLQRCVRSVSDQQGVTFEHLVMDGGSTDGSVEWLQARPGVDCVSQKDEGMYDALNRGFGRARGEVLAWLNCDEQYLPGTLRAVSTYLHHRPHVDFVYGDALLLRPDGSAIAHRKAYPLRWPYVLASHLYILSCTLFLRRRLLDDGDLFDTRLRDIGDQDLLVRLLRKGRRGAHVRRFLSAFTMTGANMSAGANAAREKAEALAAAPAWVRRTQPLLDLARRGEKLAAGAFRQRTPVVYSVYDGDDAEERQTFMAGALGFRWKDA